MKAASCGAAAALLMGLSPAPAADLSPAHWPTAVRDQLETRRRGVMPAATRKVGGAPALVAAMTSPAAVHAGAVALAQGGSAADAAAVTALTEIAMNFGEQVSYAGKLELAYFEARTGKVRFLDASWASYALETDPASIPALGAAAPADPAAGSGRQTLTPGFMAGIAAMHARYGRLPWPDLFQPAIWYADNGVTMTPGLLGFFRQHRALLGTTLEGRRFTSGADGAFPKPGELMRQPDVAISLRGVATKGAAYMYQGPWAQAYVSAVDAAGGKATLDDLKRYKPVWREPMQTRFAGATVYGMTGGSLACANLGALNLLQAMGAPGMGSYWRDPRAFKAYARSIRYATLRQYDDAPRTALETAKGLAGDCRARAAPAYAAALAPELLRDGGDPFGSAAPAVPAGHHSMSVVAVDRWGDVAVLVHSVNGDPTGLVVGGMPIPNAASVNKWLLPSTRPGDLLNNDIAPLIALRGGKPVLAIGAMGTSLMPETVRLVGALLSNAADLPTALSAPPLLQNFDPAAAGETMWSRAEPIPTAGPDPRLARGLAGLGVSTPDLTPAGYDAPFIAALAAMGVPTKTVPALQVVGDLRGSAAVVMFDTRSGAPYAAEVPLTDVFVESDGPGNGKSSRRALRSP